MRYTGTTSVVLLSLGILILLFPYFHYEAKTSAATPTEVANRITSTPTPTNIPTLTPTSTPIPLPTSTPTPTIPPKPSFPFDSVQSELLSEINNYRKSQGLGPVTPNLETCSFAMLRAQEVSQNFSHDGFTNRITSHSLPYSQYSNVVENIAQNPNREDVVPQWINSAPHATNLRADTPFGCVGYSGQYYTYEGWKP